MRLANDSPFGLGANFSGLLVGLGLTKRERYRSDLVPLTARSQERI